MDKIIPIVTKSGFLAQARPCVTVCHAGETVVWNVLLTLFSHVRALLWGLIVRLLGHYEMLFYWAAQQVNLIGSQSWYLINKSSVCVHWKNLCYVFCSPHLSQLDYAFSCIAYFLNQKILSACCFYSWLFLEILWAVMQFWSRCGNRNVLQWPEGCDALLQFLDRKTCLWVVEWSQNTDYMCNKFSV